MRFPRPLRKPTQGWNPEKGPRRLREYTGYPQLERTHIGLDFFDASINRVAAWVIGLRKALLRALLEPAARLAEAEWTTVRSRKTCRRYFTFRLDEIKERAVIKKWLKETLQKPEYSGLRLQVRRVLLSMMSIVNGSLLITAIAVPLVMAKMTAWRETRRFAS